jgi:hypothetical protein
MFLIPYKSHLGVLQLEKSSVCSQIEHDFPANDVGWPGLSDDYLLVEI